MAQKQQKITFFTKSKSSNKRPNVDFDNNGNAKKRDVTTTTPDIIDEASTVPSDVIVEETATTLDELEKATTVQTPKPSTSSNEVEVLASKSFVSTVVVQTPAELNENLPSQPYLRKFPSTVIGKSLRSFSSTWYKGRSWLEYSVERDAAFCFPCRVYGVNQQSAAGFTTEGYRDWKHALDGWNELDNIQKDRNNKRKMKGFAKHAASTYHIHNLASWMDKTIRQSEGTTLPNVVNKLENNNKQWVEVIFHVIRHLAADGLPLRGKA